MIGRVLISYSHVVGGAIALLAVSSVVFVSEDSGLKLASLATLLVAPMGWFVLTGRGPLVAYALLGHAASWVFRRFLAPFDLLADWEALPSVVHELNCLIAATAVILLGCTLANPSLWKGATPRRRFEGPELPVAALVALALVLSVIPFARQLPKVFDGPYQAVWPVALALLCTCRCPSHPKLLNAVRAFSAAIAILTFLRLGTLKVGLCLGVIGVGVAMLRPSVGRLAKLGLLFALVGLLHSVKNEFRGGSPAQPERMENRIGRLGELVRQSEMPRWIRQTLLRAQDSSLEAALAQTPKDVPFWNGETYADLWLIPIPRMLWRDKPSWQLWHEFGQRYHILEARDPQTSVQIGYLAEGYANFGYPGLWVAALIFGLLLGTADRWIAPASGEGNLFGFMLFARVFFIPADAFTVFSQLYQILILGALLAAAVNFWTHLRKLNLALP